MDFNIKETLMYYHTTLRNVGLYTSIAIAIIGFSRQFIKTDKLFDVLFHLIGMLFLNFSIFISYYLIRNIKNIFSSSTMNKKIKDNHFNSMYYLPLIVMFTNIILFGLSIYSLFHFI